MREGFKDGSVCYHRPTQELHWGIWFFDRPVELNEGLEDDAILIADIALTEEELSAFERTENGKGYREWLIPADIVNFRVRSLDFST
jgi:hypothetical protein